MNIILPVLDKENNRLLFVDFSENKSYQLKLEDNIFKLEETKHVGQLFEEKIDDFELPKELYDIMNRQSELQNKSFYDFNNRRNNE